MAEENNNIGDIIGALNNVSEKSGDETVDKNIIKSDASSFDRKNKRKDPNSGGEKIYLTKIATIFGETFKKIDEKSKKDTSLKTQIGGEPESPAEKAAQLVMPKMEKQKKGMLATMAGILLAVGALAFFLHDQLSPVFRSLSKAIFKIIPVFKSLWHIFGTLIKGTKVFQKVVGWFKPILGIIGKATTAIKGLPGGGGLLKLLAGIGAKVGTTLLKVLKFIPYIGAVINFGFAFAKFKKGDWVGGIMEVIAGVLGLLPPPIPILGMIMDGIILVRDMKMAKKKKEGEAGGEAKEGILGKIAKKVGGWLLKVAEMLPVIGGLILSGKAIFAFIKGDLKQGFIYLGRAFISYIGLGFFAKGIGFIVSLFASKKKKEEDVPKEEGGLGKIMKVIGTWLFKVAENLPVFGGLILWGKAIAAFMGGNIGKGFKLFGRAILAWFVGGKGADLIIKGVGFIMSLFTSKKKKEKDVKDEGGLGKMMKAIGTWLFKVAENLPILGGLILWGKSIAAFVRGDIVKGFELFGRGVLAWFVGGKGSDLIVKGIGALIGFAKNADKKVNIKFPSFNVLGKIASWIGEKIWNFVDGIWDSIWGIIKGIWGALKNTAKWLVGNLIFKPGKIVGELVKFFGNIVKFILSIPGRLIGILKDMVKKGFEIAKKIPILGSIIGGAQKLFGGGAEKASEEAAKEEKKQVEKKGPAKIESPQLKQIATLNRTQVSILVNVRELLEQINHTLKTDGTGTGQPAKLNFTQKLLKEAEEKFMSKATGSVAVNNDSIEGDSRQAYNMSPYSINVPA
mgnify:CR=1 FL=1